MPSQSGHFRRCDFVELLQQTLFSGDLETSFFVAEAIWQGNEVKCHGMRQDDRPLAYCPGTSFENARHLFAKLRSRIIGHPYPGT
jgi:hypothetical protein